MASNSALGLLVFFAVLVGAIVVLSGGGGGSGAVDGFQTCASEDGVETDVMTLAGDSSVIAVMNDSDVDNIREAQDVIAICYANNIEIADNVLSISFESESGERLEEEETYVERDWAEQYNSGEITRSEYLQKVEEAGG